MKQNILKLLTEAALIVFSVLLAFWIDRKNQESDQRDLRKTLMQRIYTDLQADSINYSLHLKRRDFVYEKLNELILYSSQGELTIDSLTSLLRTAEWVIPYTPSHSAYESIESSGQLQLFEKDTLFQNIITYYNYNEVRKIAQSHIYSSLIETYLTPFVNSNFDRRLFFDAYQKDAARIELKKFTEVEFINRLLCLRDGLFDREEFIYHADQQYMLLSQIRKRMGDNNW